MPSMILQRRFKAEEMFHEALTCEPEQRYELVRVACENHTRLREDVELLLDGETLAARLQTARLTTDEILDIAVPLAFELAYAHRCGITHGDVKAENVVLGRNGSVRLLGFQCNSHFDSWRDIAGLGAVLQQMIAVVAVPQELRDVAAKAADSNGEHGYSRAAQVQNALTGLYSQDHSPRRAWKEIPGWVVTMAKSVLLYLLAFRNHP